VAAVAAAAAGVSRNGSEPSASIRAPPTTFHPAGVETVAVDGVESVAANGVKSVAADGVAAANSAPTPASVAPAFSGRTP